MSCYSIWIKHAIIRLLREKEDCDREHCTKTELSIKDFFSKCDQIRGFLRIWSHLLKKSLMENFSFYVVEVKKCIQNDFLMRVQSHER